jgi:hypothetical protein
LGDGRVSELLSVSYPTIILSNGDECDRPSVEGNDHADKDLAVALGLEINRHINIEASTRISGEIIEFERSKSNGEGDD